MGLGRYADRCPGEIAVHRINLARINADYCSCLNDDERARAARFHFAPDRARFVTSRIALRHILGEALGVEPAGVRFALGVHGKPEIVRDCNEGDWRFNLSHSGNISLIAVTQGRPVGIDVEILRRLPRQMIEILPSLSPAERLALRLVAEPARPTAFLRCWTRKEALIKAIGAGLTQDLASFSVSIGTAAAPVIWETAARAELGQWSLHALDQPRAEPTPFIAALAVSGAPGPIRLLDFHLTGTDPQAENHS